MALSAEKEKALAAAMSQIDRKYGKGSIMKMGEASSRLAIEAIPTGSIALDLALGIGGIPRGRVIEIYGPESSGKTTLAQHIVAETQRIGGIAAFIDAEHAFDPVYAAQCGVQIDDLLISQPDTGEQALEICDMLVRSNAVDVIIIDSVAALVPRAEIEGDMGDSLPGLQARLMSQALRKLSGAISKSHTAVVFLNQLRMKIGVMFGSPEVTTGGQALKFYASVRLDIRRIETIRQGEETLGQRSRVKVVKNKVAPPFAQVEFDIMRSEGISRVGDLLDVGIKYEIIRKSGAWYYLGDDRLAQGRENVKSFLRDNPAVADEIERLIRERALTAPPVMSSKASRARADAEEDEEDEEQLDDEEA
ncbi:MAG: recombinase RecA [Chloroflexaceae bacterium]|nr:recombinase RecA [Chloroflexaceae bacterium]